MSRARHKHKASGGSVPVWNAGAGQNAAKEAVERRSGGACEGESSKPRHDRPRRASGGRAEGGKWISGAIKHPGALHRALHVPDGEKIPAKKLEKASHSDNPTMRRRAALAKTLKGMH